jgi:hypothetical protein
VAQFNADIILGVQVDKAYAAINQIERRISALSKVSKDIQIAGRVDISQARRSFNVLSQSVRSLTNVLGFASRNALGLVNSLAAVGAVGLINKISPVKTALGGLAEGLTDATAAAVAFTAANPGLVGGVAAATTALVAFGPQIATASARLLKLGAVMGQLKLPLTELVNTYSKLTGAFDGSFVDPKAQFDVAIVEAYRRALFETSETVTELGRRQQNLQTELNKWNSSSATAEKIAGKLVTVNARLNDELREQADLLRRASGVNVTELEASKGRKSIGVRKEQERLETTNKREFAQVDASIERLIQKEAELENARLDARAEKEAERAEKSLRASRNESIQTLERQIAIEERIQNVRSQRIARAASSDAQARQASQVRTEIQGQVNSMRVLAKTGTNVVFNTRLQYQLAQQVSTAMDGVVQDYEKQIAAQKRLNNFLKEGAKIRQSYAQEGKQRREQSGKFAENLALGVGFPLLFGGGPGSVLGSAAGSFVGSGFGGQILGGAVGQSLDTFVQSIAQLGQALNPVTADVGQIVKSAGLANTELGKAITELENTAGAAIALKEATKELERVVGKDGVEALKEFGDRFVGFGNQLAQFFTQVQAAIAKLLQETPLEKNLRETGETIFKARSSENPEIQSAVQRLDSTSIPTERLEIQEEIVRLVNEEADAREREIEAQAASAGEAAAKLREVQATVAEKQIELELEELNAAANNDTRIALEEKLAYQQQMTAEQALYNKFANDQINIDVLRVELASVRLDYEKKIAAIRNRAKAADAADAKAAAAASARASRGARAGARDAENAAKQLSAAKIAEINVLKERNALSVKIAEFEKGSIAALEERSRQLTEERDGQLEILDIKYKQSKANAKSEEESEKLASIYDQQSQLLRDQYDFQDRLTNQKIKQLKIEKEIATLQRAQTSINTRRELEQELSRLALPTGNFIADAFNTQQLEQAIRFENTIRGINDQIEILRKRQEGTSGEAFTDLEDQIIGLEKLRSIYGTLLPEIAAAEKQQLAYNQALGLIQGPVSSLVGGLREVAAGTKSVEQAFADFLNGLAEQLAQTAAQMIAQYIAIGIARKFAGIATGGGGEGGGLAAFTGGFTGSADPSARFGLLPTSNIPFRANGGPVSGGSPYIVGEKGPELFVPGRSGSIVPNGAMAGETVVNITVNSNGSGNTASRGDNSGETTRLAKMIEASTLAIINREKRPGGALR